MTEIVEQFYNVDDMAKILKVTKNSIYNQIRRGKGGSSLPRYIKLGKLIRFKVSDYREWCANL